MYVYSLWSIFFELKKYLICYKILPKTLIYFFIFQFLCRIWICFLVQVLKDKTRFVFSWKVKGHKKSNFVVSLCLYRLPIPYRKPLHVVVGRPIEIRQNLNPSREEVNFWMILSFDFLNICIWKFGRYTASPASLSDQTNCMYIILLESMNKLLDQVGMPWTAMFKYRIYQLDLWQDKLRAGHILVLCLNSDLCMEGMTYIVLLDKMSVWLLLMCWNIVVCWSNWL